jgi:hypothetical protein
LQVEAMPAVPKPDKQYFTVESANHRLPLVRSIVADVVKQHQAIKERRTRLLRIRRPSKTAHRFGESFYTDEVAQIELELQKETERLNGYIAELHELGVELKDLERGLVDFPAIVDGREICLCWQLGEPEVAWWHECDAGFAGRQSLMAGSLPECGNEENEN